LFDIYAEIVNAELKFPKSDNVSPQLEDLLHKLLDKDPNTRMTLDQVFEHPWIKSGGLVRQKSKLIEVTDDEISNALTFAQISHLKMKLHKIHTRITKKTHENVVRVKSKSPTAKTEG